MTDKNAEYFDEQARSNPHPKKKSERVAYDKRQGEIEIEFWKWALDESGLSVLPESVLVEVRIYAHDKGHAFGYSEIYNVLLEIADIILAAYKAGKETK